LTGVRNNYITTIKTISGKERSVKCFLLSP
jgi:hypothetical protein